MEQNKVVAIVSFYVFLTFLLCTIPGTSSLLPAPTTTTAATATTGITTTTEDPSADDVITVEGTVRFKETITVKHKKKRESIKKDDRRLSGFVPKCCSAPSNKTDDIDFATRRKECKMQVKEVLGKEVVGVISTKSDLEAMNCFLQCTSRKAGLSDENGVINTHDMTYYTMSDRKITELGISSDMVKACIITSKSNINVNKSSEGGSVCNTANHEHIKFLHCMIKTENMNCPEQYQVKSPACDKYRENHV
ncbi:hypothetical protein L9F63_017260 [Diploptera punctata]|uniref:Uncharacterized protein n=1 Tax=Diploptera punctata TaxID=6984 RepID=A0AAD8EGQ6_DIPPU|nr:hypothetical protein L9F63_017260 [Diploptera punctata]